MIHTAACDERGGDAVKIFRMAVFLFLLALFSTGVSPVSAEGAETYRENEWNYVEDSMEVSLGIPEGMGGALSRIRAAGALRVATEPYFPPQEFIDPDLSGQAQYAGADMELARLIAQRMGVSLTLVPMEFTRVLEAVAEGECDLAISALSYTPGRAAAVTLSKGYYFGESGQQNGLLIREEDKGSIVTLRDLAGRVIVAQSGSLQEALLAEHVTDYGEFRRLSSAQDCYEAVAAGWADAAAVDAETAESYIAKNRNCRLTLAAGVALRQEPQYEGDRIAARKGETALIAFVNGVIDEALSRDLYLSWYREAAERAAELGL